MTLSTNILKEKNKTASPYAWLVLLEITLTDNTIFRLVRNDEDIDWFASDPEYNFNNTVEGFVNLHETILTAQSTSMKVESIGYDPYFHKELSIVGADYSKIQMRIKRLAGTGWDGSIFYKTAGHNYSGSYHKIISEPDNFSEYQVIEWDMSNLTSGGADYIDNTIQGLRFDLGIDAADDFDIDFIKFKQTYTAFNFQLEPTILNSKGQIPTLTLRVSNVTSLIQAKLQSLNGAIGSDVKMMVVNSNLLAEDFSDLEMNFEVLAANSSNMYVEFILGAPSPLRQRFPLNKFGALHCNWIFEGAECSYDRKTIAGVTLSDPVSIEITDHGFLADEAITLYSVTGITGTLEGNYLVKAATDDDNFTIKTLAGADVDGGDFGGAYTSGGKAGYTSCKRTLTDCRLRENSTRFGGFPGMRSGGIRIA